MTKQTNVDELFKKVEIIADEFTDEYFRLHHRKEYEEKLNKIISLVRQHDKSQRNDVIEAEHYKSYVKNCAFIGCDGTIFYEADGIISARLDSYTIIPTEQYLEALKNK